MTAAPRWRSTRSRWASTADLRLLPIAKVEPTPYQRDLSPTHVKRSQEVVKIDRFVDPVVVMSVKPGLYWTPNGNHRRAVLEKLKAKMIPAILVPSPRSPSRSSPPTRRRRTTSRRMFQAIRMQLRRPRRGRGGVRVLVLGLLYEQNKRRGRRVRADAPAGGQVHQGNVPLRPGGPRGPGRPARRRRRPGPRGGQAQEAGHQPSLRQFVLARTRPLTRQRKTLPSFDQTFKKLAENLEQLRREQDQVRGHPTWAAVPQPPWPESPTWSAPRADRVGQNVGPSHWDSQAAGGGATTAARWMSSYLILLASKLSRFSASFLKVWSKLGSVLRCRVSGVVRARTKFLT